MFSHELKGLTSQGELKLTLVNGTAAAANVAIAGIVVGDELVSVISMIAAGAIQSMADRTAVYYVGAGVLVKPAGTNDAANQLLVWWRHLT